VGVAIDIEMLWRPTSIICTWLVIR
jgi:hypothetical protein